MKKVQIPAPQGISHGIFERFDQWNEEKKYLHNSSTKETFINPREIWYVKMGMNIGNEQNGKKIFRRPVLVIKRIGNLYFCIPLTHQGKIDSKFYQELISIRFHEPHEGKSYLILSQGRVFDKRRFMDQIGMIEPEEFYEIKKVLRNMYF